VCLLLLVGVSWHGIAQFHGMFAWILIVGVFDTLMADGKDDEYLVPLIYERIAAFVEDHGSPVEISVKSTEWRERLLKEAAAATK
jgi:hypothetical protein